MAINQHINRPGVVEEGSYKARLKSVEEKDTVYGERLLWLFEELDSAIEIAAFTSRSESTMAKAYRWATALTPEISSKGSWSSTDVVDRECILEIDVIKDQAGNDKNRILEVKPIHE